MLKRVASQNISCPAWHSRPSPHRDELSRPTAPRPTSSPRRRRGLRPRDRHVTAGRCLPFLLSVWTALPLSHPAWQTASTAGPSHLARFAVVLSVPPDFPGGPQPLEGGDGAFSRALDQARHTRGGENRRECCRSRDSPTCPCKSEISSHIFFNLMNLF